MGIVSFITKKIKNAQEKRKTELRRKYFEIRGEVIKFFEEKDQNEGLNTEVPTFVRADNALKELIKTPKDINFYYEKLLKYKRIA